MVNFKAICLSAVVSAAGLVSSFTVAAQSKLSIDKVYSVYLRNSGTIMSKGSIKGYFFLYQSDKIDKHTNEYTLQILDENLNKVKSIKFEDSKKLSLLESAYNGGSLSFLFKNEDTKTLDMKIYDMDGKLKYTYSREYDKKTDALMQQYETMHTDEGTNKNVFDMGDRGYVSVLPMRDGSQRTYELDYFGSDSKKYWTYVATEQEKFVHVEYMGCTDSLVILQVMKSMRAGSRPTTHLVGINVVTKKKAFDVDYVTEKYTMVPSNVLPLGDGNMLVMGTYFDKDQNVIKDNSRGMALYQINTSGEIITKVYNDWVSDIGKYLPASSTGKIDDVGYLYIHKVIRTPDQRFFVVGEGHKRKASAGGIALTALSAAAGMYGNAGVTKIVITNLVMMEFDPHYKVAGAKIYEKTQNTAVSGITSDYVSQHMIAMNLKAAGAFDYEFTTGEADNSSFAVCYSDYERSSDYKGQTFHAIRYNGTKFSTDRMELKSKASNMKVFPAKAGNIMILEYFKKDKRLDFRLEKLG